MTYLMLSPWRRVNEIWVDSSIDSRRVTQDYQDLLIQGIPNNPGTRFQADFYKHISVDIVTETVYNYPYPCITEKTLRPISCKRMFILVAPAGTLELLRYKGFKTFSNVIDENYDLEADPITRWHLICQSIKRFVTKPIEELKTIVEDHADVLDHNFNILLNLEKVEIKNINDTH